MDDDNPVKKKIKANDYHHNHYPFRLATVVTPLDCEVFKVFIKDDMYVEEGQSMFVLKVRPPPSFISLQISSEEEKSKYKKILERFSRVGIFSMKDVLVDNNAAAENSTPMQWFDNDEDVMQRYQNFKKFDAVVDHSDHFFSSQTSGMKPPGWTKMIKEEWRILEEQLPGTIFVRVYELRMNLLRAVIIGPEGTPYHNGLFFFDVCFPDNYPHSPPLVRYHSGGLGINPNLYKSGEVCFRLFNIATQKVENLWVPETSNILQLLVSIQDLILNTKPYFYEDVNEAMSMSRYVYAYGDWFSLLYNENTIIKSLKTMMYTMNKPPKNFENFVIGHFRNHVHDILMACKGYTEGLQVGCLVSGYNNETCSIEFKKDVVSCINPLVDAFNKIGAMEAQKFIHLIEKSKSEDVDLCHVSDDNWLTWNFVACSPHPVTKVLVKEGMKVAKGQPLCSYDVTKIKYKKEVYPISFIRKRPNKATIKKKLYEMQSSRVGIFSMEDLSVEQDDVDNSNSSHDDAENSSSSSSRSRRRKACLVNADVLKRYVNFRRFDSVVDHSDHFFAAESSAMNQPRKDNWENKIREEWRILEEHLPETIFVRAYESRMDLLRAVIIGPDGTPYHRVLFFFDVCFPTDYPKSPPLLHYRSVGLAINPNIDKFGEVCLNTYRRKLWVPSTTTMLQLLVSIQNQFFVEKPLFSSPTYSGMRGSFYWERSSKLYNETTMIKSLKTVVYTINKRPKNFEDFVAGHYHYHRHHIFMAFCENKDRPFSKTYVNDQASMIKPLKDAIAKINGKQKSKSTISSTELKNKNSLA